MPPRNTHARLLFTIGHSNHELPAFINLLEKHQVTALGDVRSQPYSQFSPGFNREILQRVLPNHRIQYTFLGTELGARRAEGECYLDGKARYHLIARLPLFQRGLEHIRRAAGTARLALMCAEKDPLTCHRMILICRHLRTPDLLIQHILEDGSIETNQQTESRLLAILGLPPADLFSSQREMIERAYDEQGDKIACVQELTPTSEVDGQRRVP